MIGRPPRSPLFPYAPRFSDLVTTAAFAGSRGRLLFERNLMVYRRSWMVIFSGVFEPLFYLFSMGIGLGHFVGDRKSTRLNSSHLVISYAVFCLKNKSGSQRRD